MTDPIPEPTAYPDDYGNAPIHVRMLRVMADVGVIAKSERNAQQGFMFRGIDQAMNALQPCLVRHGVLVVPARIVKVTHDVRGTAKGGSMNVTHLEVEFDCWGADGDSVRLAAAGEAQDSADKATGKAHSMALKVALLEAFMIRTEETARDDPDYQSEPASGPPAAAPPDPQVIADIHTFAKQLGVNPFEDYQRGVPDGDLRTATDEDVARYRDSLKLRAAAHAQAAAAATSTPDSQPQDQNQPQGVSS